MQTSQQHGFLKTTLPLLDPLSLDSVGCRHGQAEDHSLQEDDSSKVRRDENLDAWKDLCRGGPMGISDDEESELSDTVDIADANCRPALVLFSSTALAMAHKEELARHLVE